MQLPTPNKVYSAYSQDTETKSKNIPRSTRLDPFAIFQSKSKSKKKVQKNKSINNLSSNNNLNNPLNNSPKIKNDKKLLPMMNTNQTKNNNNLNNIQSMTNNYGNITVNVNNFIIQNSNTSEQSNNLSSPNINNNPYPNNYGVYLSNSNVFTNASYNILGKAKKDFNKNNNNNNDPNNYLLFPHGNRNINVISNNVNNPNNINSFNNKKNKIDKNNNSKGTPNNINIISNNGINAINNINPKSNYITKTGGDLLNQNIVQSVIDNLVETTKETVKLPPRDINLIEGKTSSLNNTNELNDISHSSSNNDNKINTNGNLNPNNNINSTNTNSNANSNSHHINTQSKEPVLVTDQDIIALNTYIIEILFDFEIHSDSRQGLNMSVHQMINYLMVHIQKKDISFNLFTVNQLLNGYSKLMKLSLIFLIYLKYILLDFNYDITLKAHVKKISNCINGHLITIIDHFILNNTTPSQNFIEKFNKIIKIHNKQKRPNILLNPINFGNSLIKSCEMLINQMKQMSNSYFKIGYFRPIHNICLEFIRLLDTYTSLNLANLIINHVLYFVIKNTSKNGNNLVSNKNIIFNPTSLLGLYGFNVGNVQPPFLPPAVDDRFTLVLDLDETLVHFFYTPSGGAFLIRPYCFEFLENLSKIYDIAIFTAAMKDYADNILDILDPDKKFIKYRLYRHHTSISGMFFVKDLTKLGRDLKRIIIIDNLVDNFKLQPNNGLGIKTWIEEMKDNQLCDFEVLLKEIVEKKPEDVRNLLKKIKDEVTKRSKKNVNNPYRNLEIDKLV